MQTYITDSWAENAWAKINFTNIAGNKSVGPKILGPSLPQHRKKYIWADFTILGRKYLGQIGQIGTKILGPKIPWAENTLGRNYMWAEITCGPSLRSDFTLLGRNYLGRKYHGPKLHGFISVSALLHREIWTELNFVWSEYVIYTNKEKVLTCGKF